MNWRVGRCRLGGWGCSISNMLVTEVGATDNAHLITTDVPASELKKLIISTANILENVEFFDRRAGMPPLVTNLLENLFTRDADGGGDGATAPYKIDWATIGIFGTELAFPALVMTILVISIRSVSFLHKLGVFCLLAFNIALIAYHRPVPTR